MTATRATVRKHRQAAQVALGLFDGHLRHCIADAVAAGGCGEVAVPQLALPHVSADITNELCVLDTTERI